MDRFNLLITFVVTFGFYMAEQGIRPLTLHSVGVQADNRVSYSNKVGRIANNILHGGKQKIIIKKRV